MTRAGRRPAARTFLDRHRFLLSFVLLNALAGLSVGLSKVATSLYALHLDATATELGLIAGAQSVGILFMSMPVGVLVDQFGPLRLFTAGSTLAALFYLLLPALPLAGFVALCSVLISLCMPCRFVSMNAVFMQQLETVGEAKAGWFRGSHLIGFFLLGPALAVTVIGAIGFQGTYWLVGGLFLLTASLAPAAMRFYRRPEQPRRISLAEVRGQFALLRTDPELRAAGGLEFAGQAVGQYYTFFIVAVAVKAFGFGPGQAAQLVTAQGAAYVLALFTLGAALQRVGQRRVYSASFAVIVTGLGLLGLARQPALLWLGAVVLGLGLGMLQTVNLARFARVGARLGRGRAAGANAFVGPAGGLAGSLIGGALDASVGLQTVFLLFAPAFVFFAIRQFLMNEDETAAAPALGSIANVESES